MKKIFQFILISFSCNLAVAQQNLSKNFVTLSAGKCFNGSGDLRGFIYTTSYRYYYKKKWSWDVGLSGTIHDKSTPIFYNFNGVDYDGSVRATIAGIQLTSHIGRSFIRNERHEFSSLLGILGRYQSSSLSDALSIYYPVGTNIPFPVVAHEQLEPMRQVAVGGDIQIQYNYTIKKNISIGIVAGFQTDSEGDNLSQLSILVGYRF